MKELLITLMIVSPFSFADWGDVYYCQMTTHSKTTLHGKKVDYKLGRFQFKFDKTKYAIVFGSGGFQADEVFLVDKFHSDPERDSWWFDNIITKGYVNKGRFLFSSVNHSGITSVSANCDKF